MLRDILDITTLNKEKAVCLLTSELHIQDEVKGTVVSLPSGTIVRPLEIFANPMEAFKYRALTAMVDGKPFNFAINRDEFKDHYTFLIPVKMENNATIDGFRTNYNTVAYIRIEKEKHTLYFETSEGLKEAEMKHSMEGTLYTII